MNPMLIRLREKRDALVRGNEDLLTRAAAEERDELTESEQASFDEANAEIEILNRRIADLEQIEARNAVAAAMTAATNETLQRNGVQIETPGGDEPVYRDAGAAIMDLLRAANDDTEARDRLAANRRHVLASDEFLERAAATGDLGGLVVSQYLVNEFASIIREGRPFANICRGLPLTAFTMVIGRQTQGANVGTPTGSGPAYGENQPYPSQDINSTPLTVSAKTLAGVSEASVESVDFGVLDTNLVWSDVIAAYNQILDYRLIWGSGNNAQHTGVMNTAGIDGLVYAGASSLDPEEHFRVLHSLVLQAAGRIRGNLKMAATHVVMSSLRWYSLQSATDADGRPLMGFASSSPSNVGGTVPVPTFASLPVVVDDNIIETNGDDDKVLVVRAPELLLWERNGGAPQTIRVDQAKAAEGTVQFIGRGYSAFTAGRYPKAVCLLDNLPEPTFDAPVGS